MNAGSGYSISTTDNTVTVVVADDDDPPTPVTPVPLVQPVVSIAASAERVTEGQDVWLTLTADPAPSAPLSVTVAISAQGDFGQSSRTSTRMIPVAGTVSFPLSTSDDSVDEPDGSITATVNAESGYSRSTTARTVTVVVADDDPTPEASLVAKSGSVAEGEDVGFTIRLSPAPPSDEKVLVYMQWQVTNCEGRIASGGTHDDSVDVDHTGSADSYLFSNDDETTNGDCTVTATLEPTYPDQYDFMPYTVNASQKPATVTVTDPTP